MNGSRARATRKKIYGKEQSKPGGGLYRLIQHIKKVWIKDEEGNPVQVDQVTRQIVCTGKRKEYKEAKRGYK